MSRDAVCPPLFLRVRKKPCEWKNLDESLQLKGLDDSMVSERGRTPPHEVFPIQFALPPSSMGVIGSLFTSE
jgi:hypothetical protein